MTTVTKGHTLKVSGSTASGIVVQGGDVQVIRPTGSRLEPESLDRLIDSVAIQSIDIAST